MDLIRFKLGTITDYLTPLLPLANCHVVDFITNDLWHHHVELNIREQVENTSAAELLIIFWKNDFSGDRVGCFKDSPFQDFLKKAHRMSLDSCKDIKLNLNDLKVKMNHLRLDEYPRLKIDQFMSGKKSHEVGVTAATATALVAYSGCSHVVDIGGGKGYLSTIFALEYKLKVLGLDSSSVNTHGAAKRTKKFTKHWNGIRRKAQGKNGTRTMDLDNLDTAARENHRPVDLAQSYYKQVTEFVRKDTDLVQLVEGAFPADCCKKLALTGLHTCGDLSATCLRLYACNPKHVGCLVNVGCCYNLLEEEFPIEPFQADMVLPCASGEPGFPMSQHLKAQKYSLGRNARMLATQSLDRIVNEKKIPSEALLYRALLQVLLVQECDSEHLPQDKVGRLAAKCTSFTGYVEKSFRRLGRKPPQMHEQELESFYESHKKQHHELLQIFFLLRLSLAPVIETVILLDRLLYLHEQLDQKDVDGDSEEQNGVLGQQIGE